MGMPVADGIASVAVGDDGSAPVYNLQGMIVAVSASGPDGLPKGVYIYKGRKVVK